MIALEIILAVIAVLTLIFGGGLLKQLMNHSNQMAVQKHDLEQTKIKVEKNDTEIQKLTTGMALVNKDIATFDQHVRKLEMLPEINAKLTGLESILNFMKEQISYFKNDRGDSHN